MSNLMKDPLFRLIKTLTKSEKRNFRFYVNRIQSSEHIKFVQLFDVLDKQNKYNEEVIFAKIPDMKRKQLSNIKRHLYRQLLTSLRMIHIQKNIDIQIREQIDFAKILYGKGLYMDSLKVLDRVKGMALQTHQDMLHLEIIEFEKLIESRHITRSIENRADQLAEEAEKRRSVIKTASELSNLALRLYGLFIKLGHTRNEKDYYVVTKFFKTNLPEIHFDSLTFFEKIYWCQCHVWYYYIIQNFTQGYKYSQRWIDLFKKKPDMQKKDPDLFIRGYNNLLSTLFKTSYHSRFCEILAEFEAFGELHGKDFNTNSEIYFFLYLNTHRLNKHFIEGSFTGGLYLIPILEKGLKKYSAHLDQYRILIFYYKIACMYFSSGDNESAIDYLNKIINFKGSLREDLQCYARLLNLIVHYELGHYNLLEYLVKSVYRFLAKMEDLNTVQLEILKFLRKALTTLPENMEGLLIQLKNRFIELQGSPHENRSFLYLDSISWLESKIEGRPVQDVIREKFEKNRR